MNSYISLIVPALLLWAGIEVILGSMIFIQRYKLRKQFRIEKAQSYFAKSRNKLMELTIKQKININSITFEYFYLFNTALMRRPDEYPQISLKILSTLFADDSSKDSLIHQESKDWTPEVREMVRMTADALGNLAIDYSFILRNIYGLEKRYNPDFTPLTMFLQMRAIIESQRRKKEVSLEIKQAQKELYNLALA